jgi:hypothetical protein
MGLRLATEPRSATEAKPRLHRPVRLPILECGPHEQAANENGGQDDQEDENDLTPGTHTTALFPTKLDSTPLPSLEPRTRHQKIRP